MFTSCKWSLSMTMSGVMILKAVYNHQADLTIYKHSSTCLLVFNRTVQFPLQSSVIVMICRLSVTRVYL